jgi:hypothetical protein
VLVTGVIPGLLLLGALASAPGAVKFVPGAGVLACTVLGIRSAMLGIFAGPDHIVVRNFFSTHQIGWEEISGFEMPSYHETPRDVGLRIIFDDRRPISATLYARGDQNLDRPAREAIEQLEQLRQQRIRGDSADSKG